MLDALRARILKAPSSAQHTKAEQVMEATEQGQRDRAQRLETEAQAQAEAEHAQRLRVYRTRQAHVRAMITEYEPLAALCGVVTEMAGLTQKIEAERSILWQESRTLGEVDVQVPFQAREWLSQVVSSLRNAWSQGQQT